LQKLKLQAQLPNHMKKFLLSLFIFLTTTSFAQDLEQISARILEEGIELYRNERASWISTDSIPEQDRKLISGYFTYSTGEHFVSIYADKSDQLAAYKFTFQPTGNLEIKLIKTEKDVPLSEKESSILTVRKHAVGLSSMWYQQFGYSQIVNPNVIIHKISPAFEVYVIPGAKKDGLVPIGGDLRMTFKSNGELDRIDAIHNNLIPFTVHNQEETSHMIHEHLGNRFDKEYMTVTDICTLLLYRDSLIGEKHVSVHKKFISEFYFKEPRLVIKPNTEKLKIR
jgi:hypothetical protein